MSSETLVKYINGTIVIGFAVWVLHGCHQSRVDRDFEMMGRGMLEAKGFYGDLPPGAGSQYYMMRMEGEYTAEDYQLFFRKIREYKAALKREER